MQVANRFLILFRRRKKHGNIPAFRCRFFVHNAFALERVEKFVHDFNAEPGMRVLPAAKPYGYHDFVSGLQKLLRLTGFDVQVVRVDRHGKANFLDLDQFLILARFLFLFPEFELILAVIHDLADGRICRRRDLDKVKVALFRKAERGKRTHDAELLTVCADHSHFTVADLSVDLMLGLDTFIPSL